MKKARSSFLSFHTASVVAGLIVLAVVAMRSSRPDAQAAVVATQPETFVTVLEEGGGCDGFSVGVPTDVPGMNGCTGMQPPREPRPAGVPDPGRDGPGGPAGPTTGGPAGPSAPAPAGPTTGGPGGYRYAFAPAPPRGGGGKPERRGPTTGGPQPPQATINQPLPPAGGGFGYVLVDPQPSPAPSGSGTGSGKPLWDYQPNSVVQGLEILERSQAGSVDTATRQLRWAELDRVAPGVTTDSGFVFGRRYFSGLTDDGRGSTGARWVTSVTERLVPCTTADGKAALQHFSWLQPFNDPDYYYVENVPGSGTYVAPAFVGGVIRKSGTTYDLAFKNGAHHVFTESTFGIRVAERRDPWDNTTSFTYDDPAGGYGYSVPQLDDNGEPNGGQIVITDSRGVTWTIVVNSLGYMTSLRDGTGSVTDFFYATVGSVCYLTKVRYPARPVMEPNGTIVTRHTEREFTYDGYHRLHQVLDDYGVAVLTNTYEASDPSVVSTQTDANGATFTFSKPAANQTDVLTPNGWKQSYLHNSRGEVLEHRQYVANFAGLPARTTAQDTHYAWFFERGGSCNCGVITKITEPDGGTIRIIRDAALNLTEVWKQDADQTQILKWKWTYDTSHRVTTFVPPEGNAAADPTPHTVSITRQASGANLVTTRTIPARDWRTTPSTWVDVSDARGRMIEQTGPSHDSGAASFLGKWTYHTTGVSRDMPKEAYVRDANTVAYQYTWNAIGNLTAIANAGGQSWGCSYDPEGRPTAWTAPPINGSQVYTHEWLYDGNGRLRRLRWKYFADDVVTTGPWCEWYFTYDGVGQMLTRRTQIDHATPTPNYSTVTWTYDKQGNVLSATDGDGIVTAATYDERSLPWVMTDGVGTTEQTSKSHDYNADGRLTVLVERLDATRQVRFEHEYDGLDRLHRYRIKNAATPTVQAGYVETWYEAGGRIQDVRTYSITGSGTAQLVDKKTFVYADYHTGPTQQTTNVYDLGTGSLLRAIVSDFDYGASGLPMREYTNSTLIAEYTYFANSYPKSASDAHGNKLELTYDQYGHCLTETNAYKDSVSNTLLTTVRTFTRDQFGRVTGITDSGVGVTSQTHVYVYDSFDKVVRHTGPDSSVQLYQYRADGCCVREDAVVAGSTMRARVMTYTAAGREQSITDDRAHAVTFHYDGRGRCKQEQYPDSTTWTNLLNDAGLLTKIIAPSGRTIDFTYDWRGMVSGAVYKNAAGVVQRTDTFQVDLGGFIKRATKTENGITQYVELLNDSAGRVRSETTVHPGLPTATVSYEYDARGRMTSLTSPHGYRHVYDHDDRNRVASVHLDHDSEGYYSAATYEYLGSGGSVRRRITGDGHTLDVSRDGHGRLTAMQTPGVAEFFYGYDDGNRVNREFRGIDGVGDAHWYDGLGRLTKTTKDSVDPVAELASGGGGATPHVYRRQYHFDDDTHRSQVVKTPMGGANQVTNYVTHATRHHYTQIQTVGQAAVSRTFDVDGRLLTDGSRTFVYDILDNLVEVQDAAGVTATYGFDALGRRITKITDGFECRYVHAGPWLVEEYRRKAGSTNAWALTGGYVHGPGIDNVVMMRHHEWVDPDGGADKGEPKNLYFHANRIGSVTELTSEEGAVVERYRYEEYGAPTVLDANGDELASSVVGNNFLFTGREYDRETGLYHYRARAYDPSTGSFLQEDPLGMHDGLNLVAYVHANPVNLSDPFGTDGIGETIDSIMAFINDNRDLIADLLMDLLGPLEGILDLLSAATGKDITGWLRGGMPKGGPESMGWWSRACAAASAAVTIAAGGLKLLGKLTDIFDKMKELAKRAANRAASAARGAVCPLVGGCFIAGTLVSTEDGPIPIELVEAGACTASATAPAVPGLPIEPVQGKVEATSARVYTGPFVTLTLRSGGATDRITATPDHPFWCVSRNEWVRAGSIDVGERVAGTAGDVEVVARSVEFGTLPVYNLSVAGPRTYRVGAFGVLVHNDYTIYVFKDAKDPMGRNYVGRTNDVGRRMGEHGDRITPGSFKVLEKGPGGVPDAREAEQGWIDRLGGVGSGPDNLSNARNEIARR